jgi:hypothetical protein
LKGMNRDSSPTTPKSFLATPPGQPHGGGWRSAARRYAGTFFETPPHPLAGGDVVNRQQKLDVAAN